MTSVHPLRLRAFITQVDTTGGPDACWLWRGDLTTDGYARFGKQNDPAHRVAYELMVRPVPDGLVVDHLCHNADQSCPGGTGCVHRRCVNPAHLEAVTQRDNLLRSPHTAPNRNAAKTHCPRGHEYSPENTYSRRTAKGRARRECKTCRRERIAARAAA
ncbi:HNH endonuclease signature motif containing protein [Micromonospora cathayae]|uniref:HNH endonuclease signature motif containing protein n=1 Tax=Micromonospora cathayae TaxID=3028804 RepID=A0ABY7ZWC8_9ACTN|nr:HNH endonuclease signature motif containing protein [Micromonospora sp. HUAS 3]WDZ87225.1 HNH endonuclease signature motif containing protein [Micromonospora sp. HUAS 3]